jgi:uncharacterized protein (DUF927 family)
LAYAKSKSPIDYAQFKQKHKGKINVRDIENCIKAFNEKQRKLHKNSTTANAHELVFDGIDLGGAVVPPKWQVTVNGGVRRCFETKNGTEEMIICPAPVVISRRLVNIDDDKEMLEISFYRDGRWKSVIGNKTQFYNKTGILSFSDYGLHVTTGTASELVNYISDYEIYNTSVIPRVASVGRLGWLQGEQFFPLATNEEIVFEGEKGTARYFNALHEKGDYALWKETLRKVRKNPTARFIVSASFAAPLLSKIGVRTFLIHIWHDSGVGKTAALKAALSVWGDVENLLGNGSTTAVGAEQMAGTLKNLPFCIDEKQAMDDRRINVDQLIYQLAQGYGKTRGAKNGGVADILHWHNIVIVTGEEALTKDSSMDGVQNRMLELNSAPMDNNEFAKSVHIISQNNYGFAGSQFMRTICVMLRENPDYLKNLFNQVFSSKF